MADRVLHIFDETVEVRQENRNSSLSVFSDDNYALTIYEKGPKGDQGDRGPAGFSGAGEPFYIITSGSLYASTASLAIFASFSSSLLPWTSSLSGTTFDLGSTGNPWRRLYVSESIYFIKSGSVLSQITANPGNIQIGQTIIATSSIGFISNPVINYLSDAHQEFKITSGSITGSMVNRDGVFIIGDFINLPPVVSGGIAKSGSKFYFGI